ncbi:MAG: aminopeptidase P N-terminal domain-containing protein [Bacteroidetes bacterium]|nr:aminopeptidase P N-terminal domain-containing protein [Bacteroidota bacterium]
MKLFPRIPNELFRTNRSRLVSLLPSGAMVLMRSALPVPRNGDQYYPFRQESNFFWLTGLAFDTAYLIIFPDSPNPATRELLFIPPYDPVKATWEGHMLTVQEAREVSGIERVHHTSEFETILHECMAYASAVFMLSNEYTKFRPEDEPQDHRFVLQIRQNYPLQKYERLYPLLLQLRNIKQAPELELIRSACRITGEAFMQVLRHTRAGMNEAEVEMLIRQSLARQGCAHMGYAPIVAGGANACTLHYNDNNCKLEDGALLLLDFGAEYGNYSADLSRTIPVGGRFSPRQRQCYEAVLRVFRQGRSLFVPGRTIDEINKEVLTMMESEMIGLGLFTPDDVRKQSSDAPFYRKYLMHGVTHHLGLDVHDPGLRHQPLEPGMVLTFEPGLYIRDEQIGIRIENDLLITQYQPVDLMEDIPLEPDEIETLMNQH